MNDWLADGEVFQGNRRQCVETQLVLESVGIASSRQRSGGTWRVFVDPSLRDRASEQLELYQAENRRSSGPSADRPPARQGMLTGAVV